MEHAIGKLLLVVGWILAVASGQIACYILSGIASILAAILYIIRIRKELKK